jgi:nitrite reductase (NADH) small subunit
MAETVAVADLTEIPPGSARAYSVGGRHIAIYHTASGLFATDERCPHRGGPLSEGDLVRDQIVCPWHAWSFDLRTGCNDVDPEVRVAVHEVEVREGRVYVRLMERENG